MKKEVTDTNKKKKIIKIIIVLGALAILIALLCTFIFGGKDDDYKDLASYSDSFFIRNNKGKYAIYNRKGKKVSDFSYLTASSFINGTALVTNSNGDYAVINEKGKEKIKFGTYEYMSNYYGLYKARKDGVYYLLNNKGKVLLEGKTLGMDSYGKDYPFVVASTDKKVVVYSYDGEEITSFKVSEKAKSPSANYVDEFATVFYNGKTVLFNAKKKDVIATINKKDHYCVNNYTENKKTFTLNTCASYFQTVKEQGNIIVNKGNVIDMSKKCTGFNIFNKKTIVCSTESGAHFIKVNGKKAELGKEINSGAQFIDSDSYIMRSADNMKVNFYNKKGKVIASVKGTIPTGGYVNKYFVLTTKDGYAYYDKNGKKAIKDTFKNVSKFDNNGNAIVSKDGKNRYLINSKGKKISDNFYNIQLTDEEGIYYITTTQKSKKGIIDKKGKVVIEAKYDYISYKEMNGKKYAIVRTGEKNMIINLENKKTILTTADSITMDNTYIKITGKKVKYYTYKGKLFYTEK